MSRDFIPYEQAKDLFTDFLRLNNGGTTFFDPLDTRVENAKNCAIITAKRIKDAVCEVLDNEISGPHAIYWDVVIKEIEKL